MIQNRRLSLLLVGAALTFAVGPPGCGGDDTSPPGTTSTTGSAGSGGSTSSTTSSETGGTGGTGGATTSSSTGGSGGSTTAPAHAPVIVQGIAGSALGKSQSYKMILAVGAPADPARASSDNYQLQCVVDDQGSATP